ncbi:phosphatase PAP2 family protein [Endozoicomonas sp.]|uniref:phosphatase PAP2 family protein n=1 Tax=Endozoicomonas sp. TaxID=1892382 RepID=UPI002887469D|nr:phosphatase PAP2 family protein [Endozoicomonas sp.]
MIDSTQFIADLQVFFTPVDFWLRWISTASYSGNYLLICAALYWSGYTTLSARLACTTIASTLLFSGCRHLLNSPRPYFEHPELFNDWQEHRWGMPSGHSQNAVVFWGGAFLSIRSIVFRLVALTLIAMIVLSRLYLGVHYPAQIVAGLLAGAGIVFISWKYEATLINWLMNQPIIGQLISLLLITSSPWLATVFIHEVLDIGLGTGDTLPYQKLSLYSGLLFGAAAALLLANTRTSVTRLTLSWALVTTRTVPGVLSLLVIWPLRFVQPEGLEDYRLVYALFWLQGIGISLWICLIWPLIHYRLSGHRYQRTDHNLTQ